MHVFYFSDPPTDEAQSNIYLIFAKDVGEDEDFHSIKYRSEVTLQAFAKFLMLLTLPRTVTKTLFALFSSLMSGG